MRLSQTEKELSKIIFEQTGKNENFAFIRSKGDKALFNHTTQEMKDKWGVSKSKPLADFMPTILLKAKDFATEITIYIERKINSETNKVLKSKDKLNISENKLV